MLCRKHLSKTDEGSVPVFLNVYDLSSINGYAYWVGLGAYHSGLQVHGVEYAYGAHEFTTTGIFEGEPKQCEGFRFRKSILVGKTNVGPAEVKAIMEELAKVYKGNAYNLITKNCNHFCNDACIRLTGSSIPNWVNRLATVGFLFRCVLPVTLSSTKVWHHKIDDKPRERDKNKLANHSIRLAPYSNSPSTSSSSPSGTQNRGRSRTRRRAIPPSSPLALASSS